MADVLIADDDENARSLIAKIFRQAGLSCDEVGSGSEALERLKTTHYRLVCVDLVMARGTGSDVLDYLDEMENPPQCIVISALAELFSRRRKNYTVLQKPVEATLLALVAARLGSARLTEPK